jgi:hypothetical protein
MAFVFREQPIQERIGNQTTQLIVNLNLGSYATGGVSFDALKYGESGSRGKVVDAHIGIQGGYSFEYDRTNKKIKGYVVSTGAEIGNATDLSALSVRGSFYLA